MKRMKPFLLLGWTFVLSFMIFACSDAQTENKTAVHEKPAISDDLISRAKQLEKEGIPGKLASVVDHFRRAGLAVDDVHPKAYERIGAVGGIGLTVEGGGGVEIYLFDLATANETLATSLRTAQKTEMFLDPNINRSIPAVVNNDVMLVGLAFGKYTHPAKDRIMEIFKKF
jgi:hypothetical protein